MHSHKANTWSARGWGGSNSKASRVNPTATTAAAATATTTTATAAEIFVQLCLAGMLQTPTYPIHSTATPPAPTACHCLLPSPFALQNRVIGIFKQNSRFNTFWRMCVRVCVWLGVCTMCVSVCTSCVWVCVQVSVPVCHCKHLATWHTHSNTLDTSN